MEDFNTEDGFGFGDSNDGFDLPDFSSTGAPTADVATEAGSGVGVDEDDVWGQVIDHEEEDKAYKATQPPGGWYMVQGLTATRKAAEPLKKFPNLMSKPSLRLFGFGFKDVDGKTVKAKISFTISPVLHRKVDYDTGQETDKLSHSYKLYVSAKNAYEKATGTKPVNAAAIEAYLSQSPLKIRTMQGEDGLIVLDLQEVRG